MKHIYKVLPINGKLSTIDLSQGQRKQLALLIAYLEDSQFYVFDEWAADQDPEFKDFFMMRYYLNS
jgi:putative pyoverdin transport system ATP-binding/permease protein